MASQCGPGNQQGGGQAPKPSSSARIQYVIQNPGAYNEHLMMFQEFKKPGRYTYYTSSKGNDTIPAVNPNDEKSLNRGISLATELLTNPVLVPTQQFQQ